MITTDSNFKLFIDTIRKRKKLVLFVGAGVNAGFVPLWNELLNSLIRYCTKSFPDYLILDKEGKQIVIDKIKSLDNYEKATIVKHYLKEEYLPALHEILYGTFNQHQFLETFENNYPFISELAKFAQNKLITAIVSYNYDEILSWLIRKKGRVTANVFGQKSDKQIVGNTLPVYYIHGFVPLTQRIPIEADSAIVLSQDEYFNFMTNDQSWQTVFQLNFLMSTPSLFLGCSLSDVNMLRLLTLAKKSKTKPEVFNLAVNDFCMKTKNSVACSSLFQIKNAILDDYGVKTINAGTAYSEIPYALSIINNTLQNDKKRF